MSIPTDKMLAEWDEACQRATVGPWVWVATEDPNQEGIAHVVQGEWEHLASMGKLQALHDTFAVDAGPPGFEQHVQKMPDHASPILFRIEDKQFIETAREALPQLLAEVRRLRDLLHFAQFPEVRNCSFPGVFGG